MDHETRIVLARRVTDFVLQRHPEVVAIAIHGSTAHDEDRMWSDLEMFAVTRGKPAVRGYGTIYDGIVVEVAFVSEEDAERSVRGVPWSWPFSVDGWLQTVATHDPGGLLPRLSALAAKPESSSLADDARGSLVGMYEDLCKMRNHVAAGEDGLVRFMAPNFATFGLARVLAFLNGKPFNGTRNLLTKPREFEKVPPHFWEDYPALLATEGSASDLLGRAERMYEETRELLRAQGRPLPGDLSLEEGLEQGRSREP